MNKTTGTKSASADKPFYATVSAKYIPVLSGFTSASPEICLSAMGIHIEPCADGGVILVASNGYAMCAFRDAGGASTKPATVMIPPNIVKTCRRPDIPVPLDCNGDEWEIPVPEWMLPGKVMMHDAGIHVLTAALPVEAAGWDEGMGCQLAGQTVSSDGCIREGDYRVMNVEYLDWRSISRFSPSQAGSPLNLGASLAGLFRGLEDLKRDGQLVSIFPSKSGAEMVLSRAVPEFFGMIMSHRAAADPVMPPWAAQ